jgi:hypothetical protein
MRNSSQKNTDALRDIGQGAVYAVLFKTIFFLVSTRSVADFEVSWCWFDAFVVVMAVAAWICLGPGQGMPSLVTATVCAFAGVTALVEVLNELAGPGQLILGSDWISLVRGIGGITLIAIACLIILVKGTSERK